MEAFLDFEASSLSRRSYPIEVGWVFADGRSEALLIRPAPGWDDWDPRAEAIHHLERDRLEREGAPHDEVARRMVEALAGHALFASAPSWDGKWLSVLLRAAGLSRTALRLRGSEESLRETAGAILAGLVPPAMLAEVVGDLVVLTSVRSHGYAPAHRALPDAIGERERWLAVRDAALRLAERLRPEPLPTA